MKKLALSFSVIIVFTFYTLLYQKNGAANAVTIAPPASLALATPATPVATTASSPPSPPPPPANKPTKAATPTPTPAQNKSANTTPSSNTTPSAPATAPTPPSNNSPYRDGTFTGASADAYYGNVKVAATIQNGRLTDVQFLDHPGGRATSDYINSQAMPYLIQEAIQAQSANIDGVSGATDTSLAFVQSLSSALTQAKK